MQTEPADNIRAVVEADLADVPFRVPILDGYEPHIHDFRPGEELSVWRERIVASESATQAEEARVDRRWVVITEAARRAIMASPEARVAAAAFVTSAVQEMLPQQAVQSIADHDERMARIARTTHGTLGTLLNYAPVPDAYLKPDVNFAPDLFRKEKAISLLTSYRQQSEEWYKDHLDIVRKQVTQRPGVTDAERQLVARRYRYARDVKILSLMAELQSESLAEGVPENGLVQHVLPSGTKLAVAEEALASQPNLLHPQAWQSRRQIKDRVYLVHIDNKRYILKERKTPRHTDVKKHGHVDGLTSSQEFAVAREFAGLGVVRSDDMQVRWEKPLGYVTFPDGFQFCLFEHEPDLEPSLPGVMLTHEIIKTADQYQEEFKDVSERAKQLSAERNDIVRDVYDPFEEKPKFLDRWRKRNRQPADELTFEEFAELKSRYLVAEATRLLQNVILERGYVNSDADGFALRVLPGIRPILEVVGFDFEYYMQDPGKASELLTQPSEFVQSGGYAKIHSAANRRRIVHAASFAMLEQLGYPLPRDNREATAS